MHLLIILLIIRIYTYDILTFSQLFNTDFLYCDVTDSTKFVIIIYCDTIVVCVSMRLIWFSKKSPMLGII